MAGIGFVLNKLLKRDNLFSPLQAYLHSAIVSAGPWMLTVICITAVMIFGQYVTSSDELLTFRLVIIYNFAFSLVFSGIIVMLISRYISDQIYMEDFHRIPSAFIGALLFLYIICTPIVAVFYFAYIDLPLITKLAAFVNFMVIATIWLILVFISTLKDFNTITYTFLLGLIFSFGLAVILAQSLEALGLIIGFTLGLTVITSVLIARILATFNYPISSPFDFLRYFKEYWDLPLTGFIYNCAIWVDKWVMWFSPQREVSVHKFIFYSNYDSAMFLAYLTVVPAMAMFMLNAETDFFIHYTRYFKDIQKQATLNNMLFNKKQMASSILRNGRNIIIIQAVISITTMLLAPKIFSIFNINFLQLGIFRYGVIGSMFQIFSLFTMIIITYFDDRRSLLYLNLLFLIANAGLTAAMIGFGFPYYGLGFLLASITIFIVSGAVLFSYMEQLDYHVFISRNPSIEQ